MTEEEKEEYEELKSLLYTGQISQYGKRKLIEIIEKQDTEINKLNKVIDRTTKYIEELIGSCPYDTFDYKVRDCNNECKDQMAECWKEYFMKEDK